MTVHSSGEPVESVVAQLRAEEPLEQDPTQQAVIRHECGVLEEARGDLAAAARDHLAACDGDPDFREPLEALARIYQRVGDHDRLGRVLEQLVDVSRSATQSSLALWELACHRQTVQNDIGLAKSCLEQAVEQDPAMAAAWLELELLAAKDGDVSSRIRALEARANLTTDPTWQGLLLVELAERCAESGDVDRASSVLDTAVALEGRARYRSRLALAAIAQRAGDHELHAHALEGRAELIARALDEPETAERNGVPAMHCSAAHAADAWLRAGELRRRSGDAWGAVAALSGAAERLGDSALVARLRMAAADAAGDAAAAVKIAREQLEAGIAGAAGSSLWMRVGQACETEEDLDGALEAYGKALELDPQNIAALTMRTDLLAGGDDPSLLAQALEARAAVAGSPASQSRAWITVAYVWAVRAADMGRGRQALARAVELGMQPDHAHRVARSFAALAGDDAWYLDATAQLAPLVADPIEKASLVFELGRMRLLAGDAAGALIAFEQLATAGDGDAGGAWLGRALAAYVVGMGSGAPRSHGLVSRLAESEADEAMARGLTLVAAMLANRSGEHEHGALLLAKEHEREPGDVVIAVFLADVLRRSGRERDAALVLSACAGALAEPQLSAALLLEAGFVWWSTGAHAEALQAFEQTIEFAPLAARTVLAWALRGAKPDDPEARLRAIELTEEADDDRVAGALERLGIALAARDGDDAARGALEQLEELNPGGDVALATALARVLLPGGDEGALHAALLQIEDLGDAGATVATAERFRVARFVDRDAADTLRAARAWATAEPAAHSVLEWLAAAQAADDRDEEIDAREALIPHLEGEARVAVAASTAIARLLHVPGAQPLLRAKSATAALLNLELALPGSDPSKRAVALRGVGVALGADAQAQAARMAAWSDLAGGAFGDAQKAFQALSEDDPDDMVAWEGLRAASAQLGDHTTRGIALARLGNLCQDDERSAELWEQAGLVLLDYTEAHADAEIAFQRALERDVTRGVAFDKLFRRVRARKDNDRLLQLIDLRLKVTDDTSEIIKMYWERARVYRDKGDNDRALSCLKDVTILEPDHVGALALAGEIAIKKGDFAEAAPFLAKLATLDGAPKKQRLLSGIAAVDLYEKKLGQPDKSLGVLSQLYRDGLSTLKVRERLARTAAKVGNWDEAVRILERLMEERDQSAGRAEAARLAMAIYRDKLRQPSRAAKAVGRLLSEVPDDRESLELLLTADVSDALKSSAVPKAKQLILQSLADAPFDRPRVELLANIAALQKEPNLRRAALGVALALGNEDSDAKVAIAELDARAVKEPQIVLNATSVQAIADPDDIGPIPLMLAIAAPAVSEAMGPNLKSEDLGRKNRVDSAHPVRAEVARWMGALGFGEFQVYVGGREPTAVKGVSEDEPVLVVGSGIATPLDIASRLAVAREVFALRRGTTCVMYNDDNTVASIVVAICQDAGVEVADPPYAVFKEIQRRIKKAMSRKIRNQIRELCQQIVQSGQDAHDWAGAARRSIDRMALIAAGDAGGVLDAAIGPPGSAARLAMSKDVRAKSLLSFALSSEYLELRQKLGMGVA